MIKFNEADGKAHIHCYAGENMVIPVFSLLIFVLLLIGFNIFYFRTTIAIVGILALITFVPAFIGTGLSMGMKKEAHKEDIIQLFGDGLQIPKHPLTP
jgi:hypothetical protein